MPIQFSVTKNGEPLNSKFYTWDEDTRTFSTMEDNLELDFSFVDCVTFKTGSYCTFTTRSFCTFTTGSCCTFNTRKGCTFNTGECCIFDTDEECVCIRRDIFEVIHIPPHQKIKLNLYQEKGYTVINSTHIINIAGIDIELSEEAFNNLKKQFCN